MSTVAATAIAIEDRPTAPLPRLLPKPQPRSLGGFFHCPHGIPEHHPCKKCEEESRNMPSLWDRD